MIANLTFWLLDFWFSIFSRITGLILKPLFDYLANTNFISENYLDVAQEFLNTWFYPYIKFSRDVFINVTGLPLDFFAFFVFVLFFVFALFLTMNVFKFILNGWSLYRSGQAIVKAGKKL